MTVEMQLGLLESLYSGSTGASVFTSACTWNPHLTVVSSGGECYFFFKVTCYNVALPIITVSKKTSNFFVFSSSSQSIFFFYIFDICFKNRKSITCRLLITLELIV